jgi:hypothetical protein
MFSNKLTVDDVDRGEGKVIVLRGNVLGTRGEERDVEGPEVLERWANREGCVKTDE